MFSPHEHGARIPSMQDLPPDRTGPKQFTQQPAYRDLNAGIGAAQKNARVPCKPQYSLYVLSMHSADATAIPVPNPTDAVRRAINVMLTWGRDLLDRIQAVPKLGSTDHLPRRFARQPQRAEQRVLRTLGWVIALARTLAGDSSYLLPPRRIAPRLTLLRLPEPQMPRPPATERQRDAAHLRYIRKIFATQSVSRIAKRLARRLGAEQGTDLWPEELLAITDTPAAWAAKAHRAAPKQPPSATPPPHPPQAPSADAPPVAFHRRE